MLHLMENDEHPLVAVPGTPAANLRTMHDRWHRLGPHGLYTDKEESRWTGTGSGQRSKSRRGTG